MEIAGQIIGFIGMTLNIISFQAKTGKKIIIIQLISSVAWLAHFFLIGAYTGAILNGVCIIRNTLYAFKDRYKKPFTVIVPAFVIALFIAAGILTYTDAFSILPMVAMVLSSVALYLKKETVLRLLSIIVSALWLTYNIRQHSIAGSLTEAFSIVSIIIALIRYDIVGRRKNDQR